MSEYEYRAQQSPLEKAQHTFARLGDYLSGFDDTLPYVDQQIVAERLQRYFDRESGDGFEQLRDSFMMLDASYHEAVALYFSGYSLESLEVLSGYASAEIIEHVSSVLGKKTSSSHVLNQPQPPLEHLRSEEQPLLQRDVDYLYSIFGDMSELGLTSNDAEAIAATLDELDVGRRSTSKYNPRDMYTWRFKGETHSQIAAQFDILLAKVGAEFQMLKSRLRGTSEDKQVFRDILQLRVAKYRLGEKIANTNELASRLLSVQAAQLVEAAFGSQNGLDLTTDNAWLMAVCMDKFDTLPNNALSVSRELLYSRFLEGNSYDQIAEELELSKHQVLVEIERLKRRMQQDARAPQRLSQLRAMLGFVVPDAQKRVPTKSTHPGGDIVAHAYESPSVASDEDIAAIFIDSENTNIEWQASALCSQIDPEEFFPEKGGSTKLAKKVCERCIVRDECLQVALDNDERFGIWGGKSERERRAMRKKRELEVTLSRTDRHTKLVEVLGVADADVSSAVRHSIADPRLLKVVLCMDGVVSSSEASAQLTAYYENELWQTAWQDYADTESEYKHILSNTVAQFLARLEECREDYGMDEVNSRSMSFYDRLVAASSMNDSASQQEVYYGRI